MPAVGPACGGTGAPGTALDAARLRDCLLAQIEAYVARAVSGHRALRLKPSRVLVVAGTQMRDSHVIDGAGDFGDIVALLKLWGVAFDVLRLDTHTMTASDIADSANRQKYGAIVWAAGQAEYPWQAQDYGVLAQAVHDYHIGLIAVADRIQERTIQDVLGLRYAGSSPMRGNDLVLDGPAHFVTRGLESRITANNAFCGSAFAAPSGPTVTDLAPDVVSLATAGGSSQVTVRTLDASTRTRAVWLGVNGSCAFADATVIKLLRRALVWVLGYAVYKDYGHSVVLRMDDPGCAGSAYLSALHYRQLTLDDFRDRVIAPLRAHNAKLGVAFCAGYPDPELTSHAIVRSWTVHFDDHIDGTPQHVDSTYAGLKLGISSGVIEVQGHGFTHMVPDLDTPPPGGVSWWDGSRTVEWGDTRWYREFRDERRAVGKGEPLDIDPGVQIQRLTQAASWIKEAFGRPPLMFIPPGHDISGGAFMNSARYEGGGEGSVTVSLSGAAPDTVYTLQYGSATWTTLGSVSTDAYGRGFDIVSFPRGILGTTGTYFTVNRDATQFIAGPVVDPLAYGVSLLLRDRSRMTPEELAKFPLASDVLADGFVNGSAHLPPHVSPQYTYKLAAEAGYGIADDMRAHYLGRDYVITLGASRIFTPHQQAVIQGNFNRGAPAVLYHHDANVVRNAAYYNTTLGQLEARWPDVSYLSMDEWTAYMHAALDAASPTTDSARFEFSYDSHYCRYFAANSSHWVLHVSDEVADDLRAIGPTVDVVVDGARTGVVGSAAFFGERLPLTVPAGGGRHSILFRPDSGCSGRRDTAG